MFRRLHLLGGSLLLLSACASPQPTATTSNLIAVNSTPPGATASVSSGEWCVTPCTLHRPIAGTFTVRLQKDGFEPQDIRVEPEMASRTNSQLRRVRKDPDLRRQNERAQEPSYAPVMAQLQPLPGNPDAQIAALVYAQKVDPVMRQAVGSNDLDKRAATGQQLGVRVAGYDQAPVEMAHVSARPGAADEAPAVAAAPKQATGAPTGITASAFDRQPVPAPSAVSNEATGDVAGGASSVVDIPLDGGPAADVAPAQTPDQQVAMATPEPKRALPPMNVAPDMGSAMVQLASFSDQAAADQAADRFMRQYGDVLDGLIPDVQMADLGEKGIYYRVRFAGLATIEEARAICADLAAGGQGCMAVNR